MNTSSVRKSIWVNSKEPKNKFDIWIKRQNNSYSLNVFDNGEWNLISVGSTPSYDSCIKTVSNKQYEYTYNGMLYTASGITQFHLPLFRNLSDSPDELFDAGTLGQAIKTFVTDAEWELIVLSSAFTNVLLIRKATYDLLGGVKAFTDIIPNASGLVDNYIASRFVEVSGSTNTDCYLYIKASDIVDKIGSSIIDEIQLATTTKIGGIKSKTHDSISENDTFIDCKLNPSGTTDQNMLSINTQDVINFINNLDFRNSLEHPENMSIINGNGTIVDFVSSGNNVLKKIDIQGLSTAPTGSVFSVGTDNSILYISLPEYTTYSSLNALSPSGTSCVISAPQNKTAFLRGDGTFLTSFAIGSCGPVPAPLLADAYKFLRGDGTWQSITGGTDYAILSSGSSQHTSYVVKGGGTQSLYLNGYGQWTTPINTQYSGGIGVNISGNTINIDISGGTAGLALVINEGGNNVEWRNVAAGYNVLNHESHSSGTQYVIKGGGNRNLFLNGYGDWVGAVDRGGISINNDGIYISGTDSVGNRGKYLYLTSGGTEWREINDGQTYNTLNSANYTQSGPFVISGLTGGNLYYLNGKGGWSIPTDTTYNDFVGSTDASAGTSGLVPAPGIGERVSLLTSVRGNSWQTLSTLVPVMTGASGSTGGDKGLVPAPASGDTSKFLCGDGTWKTVSGGSGSTYTAGVGIYISGSTISQNTELSTSYNCSGNDCYITGTTLQIAHGGSGRFDYYKYYNISNARDITIHSVETNGNPIILRVMPSTGTTNISCQLDKIDSDSLFGTGRTAEIEGFDCLITILYGIVKFEKIITSSSNNAQEEDPIS